MQRALTTADHAEAWQQERGQQVPTRDTPEWNTMYQEWIDYAFANFAAIPPAPETRPVVVRKNSICEEKYLNASGKWGSYSGARRFPNDDAAERFARRHGVKVFGLFN